MVNEDRLFRADRNAIEVKGQMDYVLQVKEQSNHIPHKEQFVPLPIVQETVMEERSFSVTG